MANVKISDLAAAAALGATDLVAGVQGGATVKMTIQQIITAATGSTGITGGTVTVSTPLINLAQTWNDGAVTFTGWKLNVTSTASAAASLLLDLQVGGSSKLTVRKDGAIAIGAGDFSGGYIAPYDSGDLGLSFFAGGSGSNAKMVILGGARPTIWTAANGGIGWSSNNNPQSAAADTVLLRDAAGVVKPTNAAGDIRDFKVRNLIAGGTQATNMTDGFIQVPGAAGAATGVPSETSGVPLYYDKTNNVLMAYNGGWKISGVFS